MSGMHRRIAVAVGGVWAAVAVAALLAGAPYPAVGVGALAGAAVALLAVAWLRRSVAAPLEAVQRLAEDLGRDGRGRHAPTSWPADLRPLADALDRLAARVAERVRESEEQSGRLQAVIEAMAEGVLVVDADERVALANPQIRTLFATPLDLQGRSLLEAVRQPEAVETIRAALREGRPVVREVELRDVADRRLRVHAAPFPRTPPWSGVVTVVHDVTQVRQLERVRRDFVVNASHELKTPLTAISGFAERLVERKLEDPDAARAAEIVLANARRLGAIVEDLMDLSRIESGAMHLTPERVDVAEIASRLLAELDDRLVQAGLEADLHVDGSPRAWVDRRALEQILLNLLDNAMKYTEAGGNVRVKVRERDAQVLLEVEDTGIGVPARDLARIFERFYRVDPGRSRALGGTGLGLAIVKHLVQALGGEIGVRSQLGRGTTFTVTLPTEPLESPRGKTA